MIKPDKKLIKSILPKRDINSNKGDFGKVFNLTGSEQYIGAGILSALASLRVGAGYSIICTENQNLKNFSPDLIYKTRNNKNINDILNTIQTSKINSIVLGCGIGTSKDTIKFVKNILFELKNSDIPIVIDADGLNCITLANIKVLPKKCIMTPHPKELSRLLNIEVSEIIQNRKKYLILAKEKYNAAIILKGYKTLIIDDDIYENQTGNTTLSKAGTGDVLSGMIGGFLAQNCSTINSAILGVYLHGLAGEIYSKEYSEYSMLASDLLNYIPKAINSVL